MTKVKVLEVDQWTSTGNISNFTFDDFDLEKVTGGDSETIRLIANGSASIREVGMNSTPYIGTAWFIEGSDGKLEFWKANYDSSG